MIYTYKKLIKKDASILVAIENYILRHSLSKQKEYLNFLRQDHITTLIVNNNLQVQAFLIYSCVLDEAEVIHIYVDESFRRLGLASKLIAKMLSQCKKKSVKQVFLEVRLSNQIAISFYKAHQFKSITLRKEYYSDPCEDASLMKLNLSENVS